ncbi:MAG: pyridoxamine 5'-phosphate oxidase family protein [Eubacteriales bacterium]|nr:pyridoxamine 5'-phosphate oxidase family protein [Eubacteriales bacterium]
MTNEVFNAIWRLRKESNSAYLSYVDEEGYPVTRAMLILEHDQLKTQYLSTNTSSSKISALLKNPKASLYYCEPGNFHGALFVGKIEVCTDAQTKAFLWRDGFEKYYPKGVTDPDYCVLKLTVEKGSHYHGLCNTKFLPEELESLPQSLK